MGPILLPDWPDTHVIGRLLIIDVLLAGERRYLTLLLPLPFVPVGLYDTVRSTSLYLGPRA